MKEFDTYGPIDQIEFHIGDTYAYIKFTDADSAADASARMKNFDLGGKANVSLATLQKMSKSQKNLSDDDYDSKRPGYIQTLDELTDQIASTWKRLVLLKKAEHPLSLYRVFDKGHLLQDILRDESGNSLKLLIS
uniref:SPOC domain-containing protein n=1 Tax=Ditylenchus dipsaci TaxID=166011 RepID=A0A915ECH7_9BILA